MVDYVVEHTAGMTALRQLLRSLDATEHSFILITKNDMPSPAQKEIFTRFLDNFEEVASVTDDEWDIGLLKVVCTPSVIIAILENDDLLIDLRAVSYDPPAQLH